MDDIQTFRLEAYKQGSDACRNYSRLTALVRVIAIIGIMGATIEIDDETASMGEVGLGLIFLAFVLALVDWHYQSAFTAMRNQLARIEITGAMTLGPWCAHAGVRTPRNDHFSSYAPFLFLSGVGLWVSQGDDDFGIWPGAAVVAALLAIAIWLICFGGGEMSGTKLLKRCQSKPFLIETTTLNQWNGLDDQRYVPHRQNVKGESNVDTRSADRSGDAAGCHGQRPKGVGRA